MKRSISLFFALCISVQLSFAATYYVSFVAGLDTYSGSISQPFKTITKAVSVAVAGDIIYLRGGTHVYNTRINISKNGTASNRFYLLAYPGDPRPILDFSGMAVNTSNRGMQLNGNYWTIRGIDFFKAGDNGMHIEGAFNIIDFCSFYENADTGLQLANGANNNQIINCDSYFNKDATDGNADGFAAKLDVGTGNSFKGCRAWQNSDDGWDGLLDEANPVKPTTTYDSCWCFMNGYLKSGAASVGNGNGFKMGGGGTSSARLEHNAILTRCLAAFNRVKGFDQNNNAGSMTLYNCVGYRNAPNYGMNNLNPYAPNVMVIKNCISFSNTSGSNSFASASVQEKNSWQSPFSGSLSAASFLTIDSIGLRNPRNADGTLPHINFLHLASTSNMIDGGVNVGLPFNGTAPDLGAFETAPPLPVQLLSFTGQVQQKNVLLQWKTANEFNNKGFYIERRFAEGFEPWTEVGFVAANTGNNYLFTDNNVFVRQGNYQYRLRQVDVDGKYKYSNVLLMKNVLKNMVEVAVYPNPVKTSYTIQYAVSEKSDVQILLLNTEGKFIKQLLRENKVAGDYSLVTDAGMLSTGTYIVKLVVGNKLAHSTIIKQ